MTGPDHYLKAEQLINESVEHEFDPAAETLLLAEAQIHATLALAAATALMTVERGDIVVRNAWQEAAAGRKQGRRSPYTEGPIK